MAELNVQQKNIVNQLRQAYPELKSYSDEQILSLYNQQLNNIQLSEAENISIMNGKNGVVNDGMGIQLETSQKAVSKEQEAQLKSALTARLNAVSTNVKKAEDSNGFLGSMWSGFKNLTGIGDSSNKVREQQKADLKALESGNIAEAFKKITGLDYTVENVNKFLNNEVQTKSETALNGYTEGQDMASDITADIVSGIAAVGIYTAAVAAAPFTGGASIAVGVVAAGASAAAIKTGIKYADAKSGGREYTADNLKKDLATGAFSGVLAPITGGMGGAVGKTVATKVGIQAVKQVGKEVAEEAVEQTAKGFVKTMLTNPTGYEYIGGNMFKRGLAFAAEAATDGAIGGAVDNAFRTAYDGGSLEDIGNSAVEGFVGGAIMSPVIGGGMKVAGKGAQKIFGKNDVNIVEYRTEDGNSAIRIDENGNRVRVNESRRNKAKTKAIKKEANVIRQQLNDISDVDIEQYKITMYDKLPRQEDIEFENKFYTMLEEKLANNEEYVSLVKDEIDDYISGRQKRGKPVLESSINKIKRKNLQYCCDNELNLSEVERNFLIEYLVKCGSPLENMKQFSDSRIVRRVLERIESRSDTGNTKYNLAVRLENSGILNDRAMLDGFTIKQLYQFSELFNSHFYAEAELAQLHDFDWEIIAKTNLFDKIEKIAPNNPELKQLLFKEFLLSPEDFSENAAKLIKKQKYYENEIQQMPKICISFWWTKSVISLNDFTSGKVSIEEILNLKSKLQFLKGIHSFSEETFEKLLKIDDKYLQKMFGDGGEAPMRDISYHLDLDRIIDALTLDPNETIRVCKMKDLEGKERFISAVEILDIVKALKTDARTANIMLKAKHNVYGKISYRYSTRDIVTIIEKNNAPDRKFDYLKLVEMKNTKNEYRFRDVDDIIKTAEKYPVEIFKLLNLEHIDIDYDIEKLAECLHKYPDITTKVLETSKINYINMSNFARMYLVSPEKIERIFNSGCTFDEIVARLSFDNLDYALELVENYNKMEIEPSRIPFLLSNYKEISVHDVKRLRKTIGSTNFSRLSDSDLSIACKFVDLYKKVNINEIPIEGKKEALRALIACNEGLFNLSPEMQKMFPMLPTDRDAYCSLLPSIVRSLGIETNVLTPNQVASFDQSLTDLSGSLAKISDADFANLRITQEYSKDDFIRNVLKIVKDFPTNERQKVYDYFGFELHHNNGNQTGFSITGYPVNLNNGKKLAQITDPRTKEIVELLRPEVIKFSEQNPIRCNNPQIEQLLNDVVDALPELRAQIGKSQHSTHDFNVLQHSLKVMQKISQDPKFKELNESDQKVMMLASLLHDITKREGSIDKTHANEGAFDTFFIAKKFNLSREEEIKLYTLARNHEWLEYVNTSKSEEQLTKRLQSVAYDLQNDNLFDMALMFTHADLRAVKVDDTFHDTTIGSGRKAFDGTVRSYGESADVYAKRIQNYIQELQKSQPLLPVTKIPAASRIAEAITVVRPDGSTNIKGVYKDKDGLIVIKYNEVDDWEAIGFPKGSISRGIEAQKGVNYGDTELSEDVNTGNIKFFVHGLDYENQLAKFDAFGLVDSDVLLSISYAERPETKYRFFRAQGVLLDFDTKYVHGGGNTDSGSGCGKSIADFKKNYIFGGHRESDRLYVSNLIKKATGMSDSEYIEFIKANENKPLSEIEPVELRETIVRAFASINSNTRKGNRSYNEMYGSNPKEVMAVFAYNTDYNENFGNPVEFLNRGNQEKYTIGTNTNLSSVYGRTEFLRRYALEHNVPFVVFGD